MNKWYISEGKDSDVAISTRIRLARNLKDTNFPVKMTMEQKRAISKKVYACIKNSEMAQDFELVDMGNLTDAYAISMVEKHLISPEFAKHRKNASLVLSHDESVSIMLCGEDHIRLQVMSAGLNLEGAYEIADKMDDVLDSRLDYAFDEKLGYLTSCPTDLGTGMHASVMLHLPALRVKGQLARLAAAVDKLGLGLRSAYGETHSAHADFYQLSNRVTLGISEKNAIENLKAITLQIINQERRAREELKKEETFVDSVYRALGTLKYAQILNTNEFMELVSLVRAGISMGFFELSYETLGELVAKMQPATLMANADADLTPELRNKLRAKLVRETLS